MGAARQGAGLIQRSRPTSLPVHPTQIYESLVGASLLGLLLWYRRKQKFRGEIFLLFAFGYGVAASSSRSSATTPSAAPSPRRSRAHPDPPRLRAPRDRLGHRLLPGRSRTSTARARHARSLAFLPAIALYLALKPETFATRRNRRVLHLAVHRRRQRHRRLGGLRRLLQGGARPPEAGHGPRPPAGAPACEWPAGRRRRRPRTTTRRRRASGRRRRRSRQGEGEARGEDQAAPEARPTRRPATARARTPRRRRAGEGGARRRRPSEKEPAGAGADGDGDPEPLKAG